LTIDAKRRDLSRFFVCYAKLYGHHKVRGGGFNVRKFML
jgi:hypothetical protein